MPVTNLLSIINFLIWLLKVDQYSFLQKNQECFSLPEIFFDV